MIDSILKLTKQQLIEYANEEFNVKLNSQLSKKQLQDEIISILETPLECITEELLKDKQPQDLKEKVKCGDAVAFKPIWSPTYRNNDEYYQPISPKTLSDWLSGKRDSDELKTIEYWTNKNGTLLVHVKNAFHVLRSK